MTQEFYGTDKHQVSYDALVTCFEHINDLGCLYQCQRLVLVWVVEIGISFMPLSKILPNMMFMFIVCDAL